MFLYLSEQTMESENEKLMPDYSNEAYMFVYIYIQNYTKFKNKGKLKMLTAQLSSENTWPNLFINLNFIVAMVTPALLRNCHPAWANEKHVAEV